MTYTLLVQTTFRYHQVVLFADHNIEKSFSNDQSRETLQFLMMVLGELGETRVDRIVFIHGPGSFTSLRIGATWVNTLAYVKNISIYSLSTLDYLGLLLHKDPSLFGFTFDDKRFFLQEGGAVVETTVLPQGDMVYPEKQILPIDGSFLEAFDAFDLKASAPMTSVLYVVPPRITLRK